MTEDIVRAIFLLAHINIVSLEKIPNEYWPPHPDFDEVRESSPWWKVTTSLGFIKIGRRKRVISINWKNLVEGKIYINLISPSATRDNPVLKITEEDQVTTGDAYCHANSELKAAWYLNNLRRMLFESMKFIGFLDYEKTEGFHV